MNDSNDLLDDMAAVLEITNLSDLRYNAGIKSRIPVALLHIPVGKYPVEAWNAAVQYIRGDNTLMPFSEWEARALLCRKVTEAPQTEEEAARQSDESTE